MHPSLGTRRCRRSARTEKYPEEEVRPMPAEAECCLCLRPRRQDNNAEFPSPLLVTGTDGSGLFFPSKTEKRGKANTLPLFFGKVTLPVRNFRNSAAFRQYRSRRPVPWRIRSDRCASLCRPHSWKADNRRQSEDHPWENANAVPDRPRNKPYRICWTSGHCRY